MSCWDCKFWEPFAPYRQLSDDGEVVDVDPAPWGTCQREHHPDPPMFTEDASQHFSALRTKRDFHCSAWEG